MEKTVKERLVDYLIYKHIGQNRFEAIAGIGRGYISNLKKNPGAEVLTKIFAVAPDLNKEWLLSGEGKMLNESPTNFIGTGDNNNQSVHINGGQDDLSKEIINDLRLQLQEKDRQLAEKDKQISQLIAKIK